MDTNWFRDAIGRAGSSQADLARHLELPPSAVSRLVSGARQMKVQEAVKIAGFLDVSEKELLRHAGAETSPLRVERQRGRPKSRELPIIPVPRKDFIPIRSIVRAGDGGQMMLESDPVGTTPCPPNLAGVRGAYAIYMPGDQMEPRYAPGWLLYVHPFRPAVSGRDVVVYEKSQAVLIMQFVSWTDGALVLCQLNPLETFRINRDEVVQCHLIVGVDQEG
jgi:phage repressor protein C with HTH and peptisase S24 domain